AWPTPLFPREVESSTRRGCEHDHSRSIARHLQPDREFAYRKHEILCGALLPRLHVGYRPLPNTGSAHSESLRQGLHQERCRSGEPVLTWKGWFNASSPIEAKTRPCNGNSERCDGCTSMPIANAHTMEQVEACRVKRNAVSRLHSRNCTRTLNIAHVFVAA